MAHRGWAVICGRQWWGPHLPRITAALTGALAVLLAAEMAMTGDIAPYAAALIGAVAGTALVTAAALWTQDSFGVRVAAGGLAAVVLIGQVVTSAFGGPGEPDLGWTAPGVTVAAVAGAVLALVALIASAPCASESRRHPYAL